MATSDQSRTLVKAGTVPLGGDYWTGKLGPDVKLWGIADTHAHLMAHLAFGGKAFWGLPYDPEHPGDDMCSYALNDCSPIHGTRQGELVNVNPEFGHVPASGWSDFNVWPRFTTMVHQQVYVEWLYRAYQGGLRLVCCLAVNNELLAKKTNDDPKADFRDSAAIATQVEAMKTMAQWVKENDGSWLEIAYSPDDVRRIVGEDKLAVVLGVEVDSLGDWHGPDEIAEITDGDMTKARERIAKVLDDLYALGIRQITPIHLADNAFGGTAIYLRFLELSNVALTGGRAWSIENAFDTGIRYRLDQDGKDLPDEVERRIAGMGLPIPRIVHRLRRHRPVAMNRRALLDTVPASAERELIDLADKALGGHDIPGGHANERGLHRYGEILLHEMMKRGMMIDVDHMSQKATNRALKVAEDFSYPVMSSHDAFRDLAYSADIEFSPEHDSLFGTGDVHKVGHEGQKTAEQVERIRKLGGLVAPILNQGDVAGLRAGLPQEAGKVPEPCAGSSSSWAQAYVYAVKKMGGKGVAIGSDVNGAATLPGPRFGTFAAYGARTDAYRVKQRRGEIDRQKNGVVYDRPISEYRWFRFEYSGDGGYDEQEREIWESVAEFKACFNPWKQAHPPEDFRDKNQPRWLEGLLDSVTDFLLPDWLRALLGVDHNQERVDNIAKGIWAAHGEWERTGQPDDDEVRDWPSEQQAGYFAAGGSAARGLLDEHDEVRSLTDKIENIWRKWQDMEQGDNPPLKRLSAGPRRDWDINLDGMAHYGLLPDFLQDLRNVGLTPDDLAPLFRSANDYVVTWEKCMALAPDIAAGKPGRSKAGRKSTAEAAA